MTDAELMENIKSAKHEMLKHGVEPNCVVLSEDNYKKFANKRSEICGMKLMVTSFAPENVVFIVQCKSPFDQLELEVDDDLPELR